MDDSDNCKKLWDDFKKDNPDVAKALAGIEGKYKVSLESQEAYMKTIQNIKPENILDFVSAISGLEEKFPKYKKFMSSPQMQECSPDSVPGEQSLNNIPDIAKKPQRYI